MKKIVMLTIAAFLVTGASFAQDKKCDKSKSCCKKGSTASKEKAAKKAKTAKV